MWLWAGQMLGNQINRCSRYGNESEPNARSPAGAGESQYEEGQKKHFALSSRSGPRVWRISTWLCCTNASRGSWQLLVWQNPCRQLRPDAAVQDTVTGTSAPTRSDRDQAAGTQQQRKNQPNPARPCAPQNKLASNMHTLPAACTARGQVAIIALDRRRGTDVGTAQHSQTTLGHQPARAKPIDSSQVPLKHWARCVRECTFFQAAGAVAVGSSVLTGSGKRAGLLCRRSAQLFSAGLRVMNYLRIFVVFSSIFRWPLIDTMYVAFFRKWRETLRAQKPCPRFSSSSSSRVRQRVFHRQWPVIWLTFLSP